MKNVNKRMQPVQLVMLGLTAALLIYLSLAKVKFPGLDSSRTFCIIIMSWYIIYTLVTVRFKKTILTALGTAVFICYSYLPPTLVKHMSKKDCVVAGIIFGVTVILDKMN